MKSFSLYLHMKSCSSIGYLGWNNSIVCHLLRRIVLLRLLNDSNCFHIHVAINFTEKSFSWCSTLFFLSFTMKVSGIVLGRNENQWREAKTTVRSFRFYGDFSGGAPLVLRQQLDRRWSLNPGFGFVNRGKIISDGRPPRISTNKSHLISFQQVGASLDDYPNLKRWFAQCATDVKGYAENEEGAKLFGDKVKSLLQDKLWTTFLPRKLTSSSLACFLGISSKNSSAARKRKLSAEK